MSSPQPTGQARARLRGLRGREARQWGYNLELLEMLSDAETCAWYARAAVEHGWSRNVLVHQIETRLHERQGAALSNFHRTLPAQQSELAQQLLKHPRQFDFLTLGATP
uniref:DUF1016 N-terminal domain-containing protein n=1 Tax=Cupriavidus ulmosensis TaxID=3065913 RepID=UPI003F852680